MKAVVAAFNQEKALVGAFSVLTNLRMELFEALDVTHKYFARIKYHLQRGQKAGKTLQWPPRPGGLEV